MTNKPNFGTEWSGTGRTDQRCVWSWWSTSHSSLAQLSFLLGHQSPPLFCCLTTLVDEFTPGVRFTATCSHVEVYCNLYPCWGIQCWRTLGRSSVCPWSPSSGLLQNAFFWRVHHRAVALVCVHQACKQYGLPSGSELLSEGCILMVDLLWRGYLCQAPCLAS